VIGAAFHAVGKDGVGTRFRANTESGLELYSLIEVMDFAAPISLSPHMITDGERHECLLEEPVHRDLGRAGCEHGPTSCCRCSTW